MSRAVFCLSDWQLLSIGTKMKVKPRVKGQDVNKDRQFMVLADLGGHAQHTPPYGTQFFCFCIHFHQKMPTSEVHAPPHQWMHTPLWEILDPPLHGVNFGVIGNFPLA